MNSSGHAREAHRRSQVMVVACGMLYAILAGHARRFFEGEKGAAHINRASAVIFFLIGLIVLFLAAEPFF